MTPTVPPVLRPYRDEDDYWAARDLLRRITARTSSERSWHVARLDYWWWFVNPFLEHLEPSASVLLWEAPGAGLVAMANPEGAGEAHLQVDPAVDTPELRAEMVRAAEARLAIERDGFRRLRVWADAADGAMTGVLLGRGYARIDRPGAAEHQHRIDLAAGVPDGQPAAGYTVRPLGDGLERLERAYASGLGFHDDDVAVARDNRDHPEWYEALQRAPLYRRDLDLVAVARDGSIAAFCTAWFDDVSRTAYLEPVATVPAHRRHGLARAVVVEALQRLRRMGCRTAFVGGYSDEAIALYASILGPAPDRSEPWERVLG